MTIEEKEEVGIYNELKDNMFIMFPSTNMYYINNRQKGLFV